METIQEKKARLIKELEAETKENLILAKKIYLKRFEQDNGLI
jgi:hypothetical protein